MLGRLILFLLQVALGWFGSKALMDTVGSAVPSSLKLYVFAAVAAVVCYLIGIVAAIVLKEVASPSSATLSWSLTLAIVAALLWSFGPSILPQVPWGKIRPEHAVLAGAILGYIVRR